VVSREGESTGDATTRMNVEELEHHRRDLRDGSCRDLLWHVESTAESYLRLHRAVQHNEPYPRNHVKFLIDQPILSHLSEVD
jgi:hypothetical protein